MSKYRWKRRTRRLRIAASVALLVELASCGGETNGVKATAKEGAALSVVVAPVIQKTVPMLPIQWIFVPG
jgi:hypothetical protein